MPDSLPLLLTLQPVLPKTACRQLHRIVLAVLAMSGRITQLGISRWTDTGGSYRTIQRFFHTDLDWTKIQWRFFECFLFRPDALYLPAGDENGVSKSGKHTEGVGWFFSSILTTPLPGLAFFSIALIDVAKRRAPPLSVQQVIRSEEEKEQTRQRKHKRQTSAPKRPPDAPQRQRGCPPGSKNKNKAHVTLSSELQRILAQGQEVMDLIAEKLSVASFVLDGHFGNAWATARVGQRGHVVLFSSDLSLDALTLIDSYALRFPIEFTFRDAKQSFGLEDFMGTKAISIANAVGLSFFLVNLSRYLLDGLRTAYAGAGINDLKSLYRARHSLAAVLKCVPESGGGISYCALLEQVCGPTLIHPKQNNGCDLERAA